MALAVVGLVVALLPVAVAFGWSAVTNGLDNPIGAGDGSMPTGSATLGGSAPGSLVSAVTMPEFSRTPTGSRVQAARVVYVSTEGDTGKPTEVSGSVFTPPGPAPSGGWPVVRLGSRHTGRG